MKYCLHALLIFMLFWTMSSHAAMDAEKETKANNTDGFSKNDLSDEDLVIYELRTGLTYFSDGQSNYSRFNLGYAASQALPVMNLRIFAGLYYNYESLNNQASILLGAVERTQHSLQVDLGNLYQFKHMPLDFLYSFGIHLPLKTDLNVSSTAYAIMGETYTFYMRVGFRLKFSKEVQIDVMARMNSQAYVEPRGVSYTDYISEMQSRAYLNRQYEPEIAIVYCF